MARPKEPIIADNMKQYIKDELIKNDFKYCGFAGLIDVEFYCHFLGNPDCGFWGEYKEIKDHYPERSDFFKCDLRR